MMRIFAIILFSLAFTAGYCQSGNDGLWKSVYIEYYYPDDTGTEYTRIFLEIDSNNVVLKNFDLIFNENSVYTNSGTIDPEKSILKFNSDEEGEKTYSFINDGSTIVMTVNESPLERIYFKKLDIHHLGSSMDLLQKVLVHNHLSGEFDYYDRPLEMVFFADGQMMVTNSIRPDLTLLDKWATVTAGDELFLILSAYGPMMHVVSLQDSVFLVEDEFLKFHRGSFRVTEPVVRYNEEQLTGIWEQVKPDTTGFSAIPRNLYDKEFYPKEIMVFEPGKVKKYSGFFTRESKWKLAGNGELIIFESLEDERFRIISLDGKNMVLERLNFNGDVYQDDFLKKKNLPVPTTINKCCKVK